MEVISKFGPHRGELRFSIRVKIGSRTLGWYHPTRPTPKQIRYIKKKAKEHVMIPFNMLGVYHDKNCQKCNRA